LESFFSHEAVTFGALQARLIRFVNNRISNGDFSERALGRILRISQPQVHNVLKGERKLTPELADRILLCFGMTVLDLLNPGSEEIPSPLGVGLNRTGPAKFRRVALETQIPKKGPSRQSLPDKFGAINTA
jgi:hypothetical protein